MGFLPTTATFSYGQRSKCADLLNSYLLPVQLAKVFTGLPHGKVYPAPSELAIPSRSPRKTDPVTIARLP